MNCTLDCGVILPWVVAGGTLALPPGCRALALLNSTGLGVRGHGSFTFHLGFFLKV